MIKSNKYLVCCMLLSFLFIIQSCDKSDETATEVEYDNTPYILDSTGFPDPSIPEDNPLTVAGVALGRMLFYEKDLSKDGSLSCAGCHKQSDAFDDVRRFSEGVNGEEGKRQAMAIFNMAWNDNEFFWDGRAHLLRDQALMPIQDELEMDESLENVIVKLSDSKRYRDQFIRAFGTDVIDEEKIALALEQFMHSIVSNNAKYDQYLAGTVTLTESEERGRSLFFTEYNPFFPEESGADCAHCHSGINFENDAYMNNGLDSESDLSDLGRYDVTNNNADKGKFKVTSLRNIELTYPYMHDGRFQTLEEVIEHYNSGIKNSPTVDPAIENTRQTGLMLTEQDKADLLAFLKTLTDETLQNNPAYSNPFQ